MSMSKLAHKKLKNKSPLRYPGGKTRACKLLDQIFANNFNHENFDTIVSPFLGGGSFEFYMQNTYNYNIVANDKFQPLYNFWKSVKTNKSDLITTLQRLQQCNIDKEKFQLLRENIMTEENELHQAASYFAINRCSFSGATLSGGFSKQAAEGRFTESSIKRVKELDLNKFSIYNLDFKEFLNNHLSSSSIIFLDPPYFLEKGNSLYGKNGDLHEGFDHKGLCHELSNVKNWILTYNDCEFIRNLYSEHKIIEVDWAYGMNKSKKSSEIVILG